MVMRYPAGWAQWIVCAVLLSASPLAISQSPIALKLLATDPAPDALLARSQPFYVRFELTGPAPASVAVSGLYKGRPVIDDGGVGAPALLPANGGVGVVSFFYWGEKPTRIDEVRLKISAQQDGALLAEYRFPVALTWLTDEPPAREPAAWVKEWREAQLAARGPKHVPGGNPFTGYARWLALTAGAAALIAMAAAWRRRARRALDDAATPR
jgi:hypothetical protein